MDLLQKNNGVVSSLVREEEEEEEEVAMEKVCSCSISTSSRSSILTSNWVLEIPP
jgi:hypothetical protein